MVYNIAWQKNCLNFLFNKYVFGCLCDLGILTNYLRGALLRHVWAKGAHNIFRQELQPPHVHVLHTIYTRWSCTRWPAWAVQTEDHPHHLTCFPLHQDPHQCHPEGRGASTYMTPACDCVCLCACFPGLFNLSLLSDNPCSDWSGYRRHAEEDSRAGLCHTPGSCGLKDAADGASGLCRHHC